jgi:hypothetical protein
MSKYAKRVVLGILALAMVVGSLTASARAKADPEQCNPMMQTCPKYP